MFITRTADRVDYVKASEQPYTEASSVLAEQQEKLASFGWVNQQEQVAHIPIDRAMQLVVADLAAGRPAVQTPAKADDAAPPPESPAPFTESSGG